jgi:hypothetical protein
VLSACGDRLEIVEPERRTDIVGEEVRKPGDIVLLISKTVVDPALI